MVARWRDPTVAWRKVAGTEAYVPRMYYTLDKIDSVVTGKGETLLVQTDHREPAEIEEEGPLSHLFAMAKVSGAEAYARGKPKPRVFYVCEHLPPAAFRHTLASLGAELHVG